MYLAECYYSSYFIHHRISQTFVILLQETKLNVVVKNDVVAKNDVVVVYPSEETLEEDKFQSRRSDSFASIDVPVVRPNTFDYNGRIEKLSHCQQNPACIAQFSCSERPFDYGTSCENSHWAPDSPEFGVAWSFNAKTGECQSFYYGGCDGSLNTFKTKMECENCKLYICNKRDRNWY
jgi:hypothetical protein